MCSSTNRVEELNTDYNALELALEKRMAQRWSGRVSYTLARARDVGAITYDTNLRGGLWPDEL